MENLTDAEKDREAVRLRRQRTRSIDIALQLGFTGERGPQEAILAYCRGAREPVPRERISGMPPALRAAAKRWNATLAEQQEPPAA